MEIILNKTNLPENVIANIRAFYEPVKIVINNVEVQFLFDPKDDSCVIKVLDPIAKTDKFKTFIQKMDKEDWGIDSKDRYFINSYWLSDPLDIQYNKTYVCDLHFNGFLLYQISYIPMKPEWAEDDMF